jgi:hypothetical protein
LPWPTQKRCTLDARSTLFQSLYFPRDIPAPADISQKTKICCNRKYKTELNGGVFHGGSFVGLATFIFYLWRQKAQLALPIDLPWRQKGPPTPEDCPGPDSAFTNYDRLWLGWRLFPLLTPVGAGLRLQFHGQECQWYICLDHFDHRLVTVRASQKSPRYFGRQAIVLVKPNAPVGCKQASAADGDAGAARAAPVRDSSRESKAQRSEKQSNCSTLFLFRGTGMHPLCSSPKQAVENRTPGKP